MSVYKGHQRGSIVILEGKLGSGWRGFRIHLRKTIYPINQNIGVKHTSATIIPGDISRIDKDYVGLDVTSIINGAENTSFNTTLTLDISLRVERGNDGKWIVLSSKINEVVPVAVKPSGENKIHSFKTMLTNGSGPRPHAAWKPKAQAGPHKALFHKSDLHISILNPSLLNRVKLSQGL
nr:hypothetical protein CFP56_71562 [Quercus suber]POE89156.1 hypothetical protein CFP56_76293 [Quercus suber]